MRILLFYDNLIRDFRGLLLLRECLRRKGHETRIEPLWDRPVDAIRAFNPETVVLGQIGEKTTYDVGRFVAENGINLVLNTTENVCYEERKPYFFRANFRKWNYPFIDLQVIISHDFNHYVQSHPEIEQKHKYHHIGCPRFDLSVHPELCSYETEHINQKYGLKRFDCVFLYISSFIFDETGGQASEENLAYVNIPVRLKREMEQKRQHHQILSQITKDLEPSNSVLLIKRHPWDKSSYYKDHYGGKRVLLVDNHDYIAPLLQASDAIFHTESTVAIEAWIQSKPSISILPDFDGDRSKLKNHMQYEPVAKNYEELSSLLADYPWQRTRKSLENYQPFVDGKATERLASLISQMVPKSSRRAFKMTSQQRKQHDERRLFDKLRYAERMRTLPKEQYEYHHLHLEQYRRRIESFYEEPIHQHLAIEEPLDGPVPGRTRVETILQQAKDSYALKEYERAFSAIKALLDDTGDGSGGPAHLLAAKCCWRTEKSVEATKHFERAVAVAPYDAKIRKLFAQFLMEQGNAGAALQHLQQVLKQQPGNVDTLMMVAEAAGKLQKSALAKELVQRVLDMEPSHPQALAFHGDGADKDDSQTDESCHINADPDLENLLRLGQKKRYGNWTVHFNGLIIRCHDLLAFYTAAKDIFLQRIYDFETRRPDPVVIDGGGHIGLFTLYVKQKYPRAQVTVFEPDPESLALLKTNLAQNRHSDVNVVEAGLFDHDGSIDFGCDHSDGSSIYSSDADVRISVVRLGKYLTEVVDYCKLNIEGAELEVIEDISEKIGRIRELVIEYHGFSEIGQRLHHILNILDRAGFRYMIHDFDRHTNPATKPPFRIDRKTRFFLLIYARQLGRLMMPDKKRHAMSNRAEAQTVESGYTPTLAQFYQGEFIRRNADTLSGKVLIAGEANPQAIKTVQGFARGQHVELQNNNSLEGLAESENRIWNSIVYFPPTGQRMNDLESILQKYYKMLAPSGSMLVLTTGIIPNCEQPGRSMTDRALEKIVQSACPSAKSHVDCFGNIATAKGWLSGLTADRFSDNTLRWHDPDYQLVLGARLEATGLAENTHMGKCVSPRKRLLIYSLWQSGAHWLANMMTDMLGMRWVYTDGPQPAKEIKDSLADGAISVRHMNSPPGKVLSWAEEYDFDILFLHRDPRGVVASRVHKRKYVEGVRPGLPPFPDMAINDILSWDLKNHSLLYTDILQKWIQTRHARLHHLTYEGLVGGTLSEMKSLLGFLELPGDEDSLIPVIEKHQFQKNAGRGRGQELKTSHNRKDVIQDWRNQFDKEGIAKIESVFGKVPGRRDVGKNMPITPVSRKFGFDRGEPIDRYYIEAFIKRNRRHIRGRVLEIGDATYTRRYGRKVSQSDVFNATPAPGVTVVGDLSNGSGLTDAFYDCIILTQTIQCIYDVSAAMASAVRALRPGGCILVTASSVSQISRYDMDRWGEYWRFTPQSLKRLLIKATPECDIQVAAHGNLAVAKAFLDGRAQNELAPGILDFQDSRHAVVLTATVKKTLAAKEKNIPKVVSSILPKPSVGSSVLLYHRVAEDPLDAQLLAVSPANFEKHLKLLQEHGQVMPLGSLLDATTAGTVGTGAAAITFDDGYADNLIHALPIIEKHKVPVTIFVSSGAVHDPGEFWWDSLEHLFFEGVLPDEMDVNLNRQPVRMPCRTPRQRLSAYEYLCGRLRSESPQSIRIILKEIFSWAGRPIESCNAHRRLSVSELQRLAKNQWVEIGAHTVNHPRLSVLSPEEQMREIYLSKKQLEEIVQKPVDFFSYPFGAGGDFTETTAAIAQECGFAGGIANIQGGLVPPVDPFRVPRRLVRNWSANQFLCWIKDNNQAPAFENEALQARNHRLLEHLHSLAVTDGVSLGGANG